MENIFQYVYTSCSHYYNVKLICFLIIMVLPGTVLLQHKHQRCQPSWASEKIVVPLALDQKVYVYFGHNQKNNVQFPHHHVDPICQYLASEPQPLLRQW